MVALIRRALPADAEQIAHVHVETWRTAYRGIVPQHVLDSLDAAARAADWTEWLGRPECLVYVASDGSELCGFAAGGPLREPVDQCDCEVYAIYVQAQAQRTGVGRTLMASLTREFAAQGYQRPAVWVLANNPARHFYARLGGLPCAEKQIEIGGAQLLESAYVWRTLAPLLRTPDHRAEDRNVG